jgi:hypothetical protein
MSDASRFFCKPCKPARVPAAKRVVIRCATFAAEYGISAGSAVPLCPDHAAGYDAARRGGLTGERVGKSDVSAALAVDASVSATSGERADGAALVAACDTLAWATMVDGAELRAMRRAAAGRGQADTHALHGAMVDAMVRRVAEWHVSHGVDATMPAEVRATILRGVLAGVMVDGGRHTVNGERVSAVSIDAESGEDGGTIGATIYGALTDDPAERVAFLALAAEYADADGPAGAAAREYLAAARG